MSAAREISLRILFLRRLAEAGLRTRRCGEEFPRFCLAAGAALPAGRFCWFCEGALLVCLFCDDLPLFCLPCGEALPVFLICGEPLLLCLPCGEPLPPVFLLCGEPLLLFLLCGAVPGLLLFCTGIISICLPCEEALLLCTLCSEARPLAFVSCEVCLLLSLFCAAGLSPVVLFNGVTPYLISIFLTGTFKYFKIHYQYLLKISTIQYRQLKKHVRTEVRTCKALRMPVFYSFGHRSADFEWSVKIVLLFRS